MRRQRGAGTVYQRAEDGLWVGRVEVPTGRGEPRRRKQFTGKTREEVEARVAEATGPIKQPAPGTREFHMRNARALGTHTRKEWTAKLAALPHVDVYSIRCHYCEAVTHAQSIEKDHYIPVSRGGSDGLDNLVPACKPCNRGKADMTGDEWLAFLGRRSWDGIPEYVRPTQCHTTDEGD